MRSYYIHDGRNELGPFTLTSLKEQKITKNTPIRLEGMQDWTTAGHIEELQAIIAAAQPTKPETNQQVPPLQPASKKAVVKTPKKYKTKMLFASAAALVILALVWRLVHFNNSKSMFVTPSQVVTRAALMAEENNADTVALVPTVQTEAAVAGKGVNDKEKAFRKNWLKYIRVTNSNYAYGVFGGISNLSVIFKNRTDYPLDEVTAKVTYIKSNGKVWKTRLVTTYGVPARSEKQEPLPKVNRGKSVEVSICKVVSKKMHFAYTEGKRGSNPDDPYFSK